MPGSKSPGLQHKTSRTSRRSPEFTRRKDGKDFPRQTPGSSASDRARGTFQHLPRRDCRGWRDANSTRSTPARGGHHNRAKPPFSSTLRRPQRRPSNAFSLSPPAWAAQPRGVSGVAAGVAGVPRTWAGGGVVAGAGLPEQPAAQRPVGRGDAGARPHLGALAAGQGANAPLRPLLRSGVPCGGQGA